LVSLILTAGIALMAKWFGGMFPGMETLAHLVNFVLSLALITVLFAMMFKFLSDARIAWHDVWIGAFLTAVFFTIGKFALGLYLGKSAVGSSYGAAGSLIVLLLWVYYSAQIFFSERSSLRFMQIGSALASILRKMRLLRRSMQRHEPTFFASYSLF
jgi:membrane protein